MSENQKFSDFTGGINRNIGLKWVNLLYVFKKFQHIFIHMNIEGILYPEFHVTIFRNFMHVTVFVYF